MSTTLHQESGQGRIIVLDPVIVSLAGHHLTSLQVLSRALPGRDVAFHVHVDTPKGLLEPLGRVFYGFTHNAYKVRLQRQAQIKWPLRQRIRLWRYRMTGRSVIPVDGSCHVSDLGSILAGVSHHDHIVMPSARPDLLGSMLRFMDSSKFDALPCIHIRVLELPDDRDKRFVGDVLAEWSRLCRATDRISFYAETSALADYLVTQIGFPWVGRSILQAPPVANRMPRDARLFRVGYLGGSLREDKGLFSLDQLVAEGLAEINRRRPDLSARFVLQVPAAFKRKSAKRKSISALARFGNAIELVNGPLDSDEFSELIEGLDVLMLPYPESRRVSYQGSGLVIDAAVNAVPVLSTSLPTLTEFIGDAGIVVDRVSDMPQALGEIASNLETFRERAAINAKRVAKLIEADDLISALERPARAL